MTAWMRRREFLATAAAAGLVAGCKVQKGSDQIGSAGGDLAQKLQTMAEQMLSEYPENATILGIAKGANEPLNHRLTDRTPEGVAKRRNAAARRLASWRGRCSRLPGQRRVPSSPAAPASS